MPQLSILLSVYLYVCFSGRGLLGVNKAAYNRPQTANNPFTPVVSLGAVLAMPGHIFGWHSSGLGRYGWHHRGWLCPSAFCRAEGDSPQHRMVLPQRSVVPKVRPSVLDQCLDRSLLGDQARGYHP